MVVRNFKLSDAENVIQGKSPVIYTGTVHKFKYDDNGKKTEKKEATVINGVCNGLGEVSFVFPPSELLLDIMDQKHIFGEPIEISKLGKLKELNVSIYNNALVFKFMMEEIAHESK